MTWLQSYESRKPEMERAFSAPIGAVSPLWWAFAGVATAGVAYWWMSRMGRTALGEMRSFAPTVGKTEATPVMVEAAATYDLAPEAIADVVDTPPGEETLAETAEATANLPGKMFEAAVVMAEEIADDLTRLVGVGPKLAAALAERGVTRFAQIADWTEDDVARYDQELKLMGRVGREDWIGQAKAFSNQPIPVLPD